MNKRITDLPREQLVLKKQFVKSLPRKNTHTSNNSMDARAANSCFVKTVSVKS